MPAFARESRLKPALLHTPYWRWLIMSKASGPRRFFRNYGLSVVLFSMFLAAWTGQFVAQAFLATTVLEKLNPSPAGRFG
jgi:hypothetical protein